MIAILLTQLAVASPVVSVSGDACPGVVDIEVTGITPGGRVAFITGSGVGTDPIPMGACGGVSSGLENPQLMFIAGDLDGDGVLSFSPSIPAPACDRPFVVLERATCESSSVATPTPAPETVWIADSIAVDWIGAETAAPVEFLNFVMYPEVLDYLGTAPCGDPLAPPVLSHSAYSGDTGTVRSWSSADPGFDQLASCLTDGAQHHYWFRHNINTVGGVGDGAGYSLLESAWVHDDWYWDPLGLPACDLVGFVVTRIDLEVTRLELIADTFDFSIFYSFHGYAAD